MEESVNNRGYLGRYLSRQSHSNNIANFFAYDEDDDQEQDGSNQRTFPQQDGNEDYNFSQVFEGGLLQFEAEANPVRRKRDFETDENHCSLEVIPKTSSPRKHRNATPKSTLRVSGSLSTGVVCNTRAEQCEENSQYTVAGITENASSKKTTAMQSKASTGIYISNRKEAETVRRPFLLERALRSVPNIISDGGARLSAVEKFITDIGNISPSITKSVRTLILSRNCLVNIEGLSQFSNLRRLALRCNSIRYTCDLWPLSYLPQLESVSFADNVVATMPNYRAHVLFYTSPFLRDIDEKKIIENERTSAAQFVHKEHVHQDRIIASKNALFIAMHMFNMFLCHSEMRDALFGKFSDLRISRLRWSWHQYPFYDRPLSAILAAVLMYHTGTQMPRDPGALKQGDIDERRQVLDEVLNIGSRIGGWDTAYGKLQQYHDDAMANVQGASEGFRHEQLKQLTLLNGRSAGEMTYLKESIGRSDSEWSITLETGMDRAHPKMARENNSPNKYSQNFNDNSKSTPAEQSNPPIRTPNVAETYTAFLRSGHPGLRRPQKKFQNSDNRQEELYPSASMSHECKSMDTLDESSEQVQREKMNDYYETKNCSAIISSPALTPRAEVPSWMGPETRFSANKYAKQMEAHESNLTETQNFSSAQPSEFHLEKMINNSGMKSFSKSMYATTLKSNDRIYQGKFATQSPTYQHEMPTEMYNSNATEARNFSWDSGNAMLKKGVSRTESLGFEFEHVAISPVLSKISEKESLIDAGSKHSKMSETRVKIASPFVPSSSQECTSNFGMIRSTQHTTHIPSHISTLSKDLNTMSPEKNERIYDNALSYQNIQARRDSGNAEDREVCSLLCKSVMLEKMLINMESEDSMMDIDENKDILDSANVAALKMTINYPQVFLDPPAAFTPAPAFSGISRPIKVARKVLETRQDEITQLAHWNIVAYDAIDVLKKHLKSTYRGLFKNVNACIVFSQSILIAISREKEAFLVYGEAGNMVMSYLSTFDQLKDRFTSVQSERSEKYQSLISTREALFQMEDFYKSRRNELQSIVSSIKNLKGPWDSDQLDLSVIKEKHLRRAIVVAEPLTFRSNLRRLKEAFLILRRRTKLQVQLRSFYKSYEIREGRRLVSSFFKGWAQISLAEKSIWPIKMSVTLNRWHNHTAQCASKTKFCTKNMQNLMRNTIWKWKMYTTRELKIQKVGEKIINRVLLRKVFSAWGIITQEGGLRDGFRGEFRPYLAAAEALVSRPVRRNMASKVLHCWGELLASRREMTTRHRQKIGLKIWHNRVVEINELRESIEEPLHYLGRRVLHTLCRISRRAAIVELLTGTLHKINQRAAFMVWITFSRGYFQREKIPRLSVHEMKPALRKCLCLWASLSCGKERISKKLIISKDTKDSYISTVEISVKTVQMIKLKAAFQRWKLWHMHKVLYKISEAQVIFRRKRRERKSAWNAVVRAVHHNALNRRINANRAKIQSKCAESDTCKAKEAKKRLNEELESALNELSTARRRFESHDKELSVITKKLEEARVNSERSRLALIDSSREIERMAKELNDLQGSLIQQCEGYSAPNKQLNEEEVNEVIRLKAVLEEVRKEAEIASKALSAHQAELDLFNKAASCDLEHAIGLTDRSRRAASKSALHEKSSKAKSDTLLSEVKAIKDALGTFSSTEDADPLNQDQATHDLGMVQSDLESQLTSVQRDLDEMHKKFESSNRENSKLRRAAMRNGIPLPASSIQEVNIATPEPQWNQDLNCNFDTQANFKFQSKATKGKYKEIDNSQNEIMNLEDANEDEISFSRRPPIMTFEEISNPRVYDSYLSKTKSVRSSRPPMVFHRDDNGSFGYAGHNISSIRNMDELAHYKRAEYPAVASFNENEDDQFDMHDFSMDDQKQYAPRLNLGPLKKGATKEDNTGSKPNRSWGISSIESSLGNS